MAIPDVLTPLPRNVNFYLAFYNYNTFYPTCPNSPESIVCSNVSTLQVPVLVDGIIVLSDSFEIAEYLEDAYSDAPLLFGGQGGQAGCKFADAFFNDNTSCATSIHFPLKYMPSDFCSLVSFYRGDAESKDCRIENPWCCCTTSAYTYVIIL
jgi:hypothetical protein